MISHNDLGGDEDRARLVLVYARTFVAPCIDALEAESESGKDAIVILNDVLAGLPEPGERRMRGLSRNGTSVTLDSVGSAFSDDNRRALAALCGAARTSAAPRGAFPQDSLFERLWPEERYT